MLNIVNQRQPQVADVSDPYLDWLRFANAGMLAPGNTFCMDLVMRELQSSAPMLEIGTFCGLSNNVISHLKRKYKRENVFFACDPWTFDGAGDGTQKIGGSDVDFGSYTAYVRETAMRSIRTFCQGPLPYLVHLSSDDFFAAWRKNEVTKDVFGRDANLGGPLSFCYIDGSHYYDAARRDFYNVHEQLVSGGFILFDDSADGSGWEVCRVVKEVLERKDYQLIAKGPNYLFRKL